MDSVSLSRISGVPFYRQIEDAIADQIRSGRLSEGDPLPSIRELAKSLLVSVITTKQAYEGLEASGLVVSQQGKGTFVARVGKAAALATLQKDITAQLDALIRRAHDADLHADALTTTFQRLLAKHFKEPS